MERVRNKVALVTGGSLGIGKASCIELAKEGARIAVTDILVDEGKEVVEEIEKNAGEAAFWRLDVSNEEEVTQVFQEVKEKYGNINVLVNNAGIAGTNKPTHELTREEWEEVMNINVTGVFLCTKHIIPQMREAGGGSIINMSSIYGLVGAQDIPPYHASKGAVRLMTKTDALHYADDKIRINSLHPGFIWTPLVEDMGKEVMGDAEAFRKQLNDLHPLGHVGEPVDIAYGVVYLASEESKFMTGSELVIDGGYTVK